MKRFSLPMALALVMLVFAAFGGTANQLMAQNATPAATAAATNPLLAPLPASLQALYVNATSPILPSAYDNFASVPTPWKLCHSESYQGNPWRVSVTNEMKRLADEFQAAGQVASFEFSDSNGDIAQQISQIRTFIDKKCSVITMIAGSATGLNEAIKAAYDAGIPVITAAGSVTSPYAINVDSNYYRWGYDMADAIGKTLNGTGNVLLVEGIAGNPIVAQERQGADDAFKNYPNLKILGSVNGNWTPSVTKQVVLQSLATNPTQVDAVWTTGSESRLVAEAFSEAGRPPPLITSSISGDALGYWNANKDKFKFTGHAVLPSWTAQTLFRVAVRVLQGQKPKLDTLMIPIPAVTQTDLPNWFGACMTVDSGSIFPIAPTDPMPEDLLNQYFVNGKATPPYDYTNTPKPCAS
ncbi:MAG: substrate-binding domain-containing protein [Aggregatilineales bacterium]